MTVELLGRGMLTACWTKYWDWFPWCAGVAAHLTPHSYILDMLPWLVSVISGEVVQGVRP